MNWKVHWGTVAATRRIFFLFVSNFRLLNDDSATNKPDLSQLSSVAFSLNAGDLIIVDSGRYLHRVTPVVGQKIRWTACSFMAHAKDRNAVYCWG